MKESAFEKPIKNAFGFDLDLLAGLTAEIESSSGAAGSDTETEESIYARWHTEKQTEKISLLDDIDE